MRALTPEERAAELAAAGVEQTTAAPAKKSRAKAAPKTPAKAAKATRKTGKKAAKKAEADGRRIKAIAGTKHDLTEYVPVKSASGFASLDSGDELAVRLRGKTLDEVYEMAAKLLQEPERTLRTRYKHLNPGMQRMNLGNRMRGAMDVE